MAVEHGTTQPDDRKIQVAVTAFILLSAAFLVVKTLVTLANITAFFSVGPGHSPGIWDYLRQGTIQLLWFGLAVNAVLLLGTWLSWRWFQFVVMAVGLLSALGVVINSIGVIDPGGSGTSLARLFSILAAIQSAVFFAIAVWLVINRRPRRAGRP